MKRSAQLTIEEKVEGQDRILSLRGSADIRCVPAIQDLINRYRKEKVQLVVIDLSATEFINSPVWAVITLYVRKKSDESHLVIVGMSERIRGSFEMMGLHRELQTYDSAELARRALGLQAE
jgi:anti-anti-sigma factor